MTDRLFAPDYHEARARFRAAAAAAGALVESHAHPEPGLACDVARFGPADAARRLCMVAGTHGVEGFAGSAVLIDTLARLSPPPKGVGVVLIHAINPWGFAHLSRCTENNVDLNRNFIDHERPRPANPLYPALHDVLCPPRWNDAAWAAYRARAETFSAAHGKRTLIDAMMRGQYSHRDGLNFGGHAPEWSNRVLRGVAAKHLRGASKLALFDWHTGLGPYGEASVLCLDPPGSPGHANARAVFGPEIEALERLFEGEERPRYTGLLLDAARAEAGTTDVLSCAVEFGTLALEPMIESLFIDRWVRLASAGQEAEEAEARRHVRQAFAPTDPAWQDAVTRNARPLVDRAIDWLLTSQKERA